MRTPFAALAYCPLKPLEPRTCVVVRARPVGRCRSGRSWMLLRGQATARRWGAELALATGAPRHKPARRWAQV